MSESKSLIKKADSAVKTGDSWLSFGNTFWLLFGSALTTGVIKLWRSALNVGWEYWLVVGLPMMVFSIMLGHYCRWRWHKYKVGKPVEPLTADKPQGDEELSPRIVELINIGVDKKLESFFEDKIKPIKKDISRVDAEAFSYHGWRVRVSKIAELRNLLAYISNCKDEHQKCFEKYVNLFADEEMSFRELRPLQSKLEAQMKKIRAKTSKKIKEYGFDHTDFEDTPVTNSNPYRIKPPNLDNLKDEASKFDYKKQYERCESFSPRRLNSVIPKIEQEIETAEREKDSYFKIPNKNWSD